MSELFPGRLTSVPIAQRVARKTSAVELLARRWLGTIVDLVALVVVGFCVALAVAPLGRQATGAVLVLWLVGLVAYYPVTEGVWGRTLGKLVAGLVVVDQAGRKPNIGAIIIRTLLRLIEVNPLLAGGIPAGIAVAVTADRQRLGDMAAQTYVVPLRALEQEKTASASVFD